MSARTSALRAAACAVLLLVSACGTLQRHSDGAATGASKVEAGGKAGDTSGDTSGSKSGSKSGDGAGAGSKAKQVSDDVAIDPPAKLTKPLLSSDVLIYSQNTLAKSTISKIAKIKGVQTVEPISMGSFFVEQQEVTYAAVDPATFRRFTPPGTAQTKAVWDRVAGGEMAVDPGIARKLEQKDGYMRLGNETDADLIHIGAYAQILNPTLARRIDAVVNYKWVKKLGMRRDNAMLVAMGSRSPQSIRKQLQKYAGKKASVQILGPDLDIGATQTAFLTGGSVAAAVGSFSYSTNPSGTINPQKSWVTTNIRRERVPILGEVTCHKVMLAQLKAALNEIVTSHLADKIHQDQYGGCYYPRFIAYDPSKGLSFHSYGTAIDLNVPGNLRGTRGEMDRRVVAIFKKWGFAWGGDWHYTDPMHFELAKLVEAR